MASRMTSIEQHPDIAALRMRYDQAAETRTAQFTDGLAILAGLYLALSAWIVGFSGLTSLAISNLVTGVAVVVLAFGFATAYARVHGVAWVTPIIGVWTILAPWLVSGAGHHTRSVVSNVIVGAVCVVLGLATMALGMRRAR
jgi:hypothetical protein